MSKFNIDWEQLERSLSSPKLWTTSDQRYVLLKQQIENMNLPDIERNRAIQSLCDYLNY